MSETVPVTCGACGKIEHVEPFTELDGYVIYPLPAGWARYHDCDEDHLQCAECEAEPF